MHVNKKNIIKKGYLDIEIDKSLDLVKEIKNLKKKEKWCYIKPFL